jgi:hypothetical protein
MAALYIGKCSYLAIVSYPDIPILSFQYPNTQRATVRNTKLTRYFCSAGSLEAQKTTEATSFACQGCRLMILMLS